MIKIRLLGFVPVRGASAAERPDIPSEGYDVELIQSRNVDFGSITSNGILTLIATQSVVGDLSSKIYTACIR